MAARPRPPQMPAVRSGAGRGGRIWKLNACRILQLEAFFFFFTRCSGGSPGSESPLAPLLCSQGIVFAVAESTESREAVRVRSEWPAHLCHLLAT
ncbi:hypothetical protein NDU88_000101 [Pleurodeles waltl]|uniref:Uncharacterized protein n=1 Tax=Pleurodeles waltl TaxID=8319 RepID=A0AAV7U410_PLEWA|nr:hypothetical protein NDU88_000101 [Pleurodeles waltl]